MHAYQDNSGGGLRKSHPIAQRYVDRLAAALTHRGLEAVAKLPAVSVPTTSPPRTAGAVTEP